MLGCQAEEILGNLEKVTFRMNSKLTLQFKMKLRYMLPSLASEYFTELLKDSF